MFHIMDKKTVQTNLILNEIPENTTFLKYLQIYNSTMHLNEFYVLGNVIVYIWMLKLSHFKKITHTHTHTHTYIYMESGF